MFTFLLQKDTDSRSWTPFRVGIRWQEISPTPSTEIAWISGVLREEFRSGRYLCRPLIDLRPSGRRKLIHSFAGAFHPTELRACVTTLSVARRPSSDTLNGRTRTYPPESSRVIGERRIDGEAMRRSARPTLRSCRMRKLSYPFVSSRCDRRCRGLWSDFSPERISFSPITNSSS